MAAEVTETRELTELDKLKIMEFESDVIIINTGHSNYDRRGCHKEEDGTYTVPTYPNEICTLTVADPGTCSFITDEIADGLVENLRGESMLGQPPPLIMKSCKDFLNKMNKPNPGITAHDIEKNAFLACNGCITVPTTRFCNRKYDFFDEQDKPIGNIYLLYKHPETGEIILVKPWEEHIHGDTNRAMTKRDILKAMITDFSWLKKIVWIDLSCSQFWPDMPVEIKKDIEAGLYAGKKYKTNKNKNKNKNKKNKKSRKQRF